MDDGTMSKMCVVAKHRHLDVFEEFLEPVCDLEAKDRGLIPRFL
jgi:hypothetical protein